jgi:hypothetical protein
MIADILVASTVAAVFAAVGLKGAASRPLPKRQPGLYGLPFVYSRACPAIPQSTQQLAQPPVLSSIGSDARKHTVHNGARCLPSPCPSHLPYS